MAKTKQAEVVEEKVEEVVVKKVESVNVEFNSEALNTLRDKVNELVNKVNEK